MPPEDLNALHIRRIYSYELVSPRRYNLGIVREEKNLVNPIRMSISTPLEGEACLEVGEDHRSVE